MFCESSGFVESAGLAESVEFVELEVDGEVEGDVEFGSVDGVCGWLPGDRFSVGRSESSSELVPVLVPVPRSVVRSFGSRRWVVLRRRLGLFDSSCVGRRFSSWAS